MRCQAAQALGEVGGRRRGHGGRTGELLDDASATVKVSAARRWVL